MRCRLNSKQISEPHIHTYNTAHLQCLMIYCSDTKSADRVLRCIT